MEKRTCKQCGRTLSLEMFPYTSDKIYKNKYRSHTCRRCKSIYNKNYRKQYNKEWRQTKQEVIHNLFEANCGGWKIYILKHYKQGEFKFNILSTTGELYQTNDFDEFLSFLSSMRRKF